MPSPVSPNPQTRLSTRRTQGGKAGLRVVLAVAGAHAAFASGTGTGPFGRIFPVAVASSAASPSPASSSAALFTGCPAGGLRSVAKRGGRTGSMAEQNAYAGLVRPEQSGQDGTTMPALRPSRTAGPERIGAPSRHLDLRLAIGRLPLPAIWQEAPAPEGPVTRPYHGPEAGFPYHQCLWFPIRSDFGRERPGVKALGAVSMLKGATRKTRWCLQHDRTRALGTLARARVCLDASGGSWSAPCSTG